MKAQAQLYFETILGPGSQFQDGQWDVIEAVAVHRQRRHASW